jgi:hypothetical protein
MGPLRRERAKRIMISFQNPPDLVLYTGARDSSKAGAAQPKGVITPGAVRYLSYADKNGVVTSPAMGSERALFAHRKLGKGESFKSRSAAEGEQLVFVKSGAVTLRSAAGTHRASEKDTLFIQGPVEFEVTADAPEAVLIQVEAPPVTK